jgi:hypothetical protein
MNFLILCGVILQTVTFLAVFRINNKLRKLMASLQERFDAVNAKLQEASDEILAEIVKLREGGILTPEQETALGNIETRANSLGDISPPIPPP